MPIRPADQSTAGGALRKKIIGAAERMLSLREQEKTIKTAHERTAVERQIEATDREIDALVYEQYGLTDEEIRIVEEATGK